MKPLEILSAHRTWIHANLMFEQFEKHKDDLKNTDPKILFISIPGTYMLIWYALLFSVCEYLKNNNAIPINIKADVDTIYSSLRRFRNAVFHVQNKYYSLKLFEIMCDHNSVYKIRKIHNELGKYFLEYIKKN